MSAAVSILVLATQLAASPPVTAATPPAKLEIVVYSDFQCPFCRQFAQPTRELQSNGIDGVEASVTFKNFPLPFHANAQLAHQAAMAAKAQGKFWEMHDLLFGNQTHLQRADLMGYARRLGLDLTRFEQDLDSESIRRAIAADVAEGTKAGVNATPSYSINGKLYEGTRSLAQLKDLAAGVDRRARALAEISDSLLSKGPADAPVTIELFADLTSPISRPAVSAVTQMLSRYPSAVRVQFRSFPLVFHPQALLAHEAAMAAARAGFFWEFAGYVLDQQTSINEQDLIAYAGRLELNQVEFADAVRQHRYLPRVEADREDGARRGLRGSPVVVVNGRRIDGVPGMRSLVESIEAALSDAQSQTSKRP